MFHWNKNKYNLHRRLDSLSRPKQDSIFAYVHANDFMSDTKGYIQMDADLRLSILMSPVEMLETAKLIIMEQERLRKLQRDKRGTKFE